MSVAPAILFFVSGCGFGFNRKYFVVEIPLPTMWTILTVLILWTYTVEACAVALKDDQVSVAA